MIVKQFAVGGMDNNFSYLIADEATKEGMIVDPCGDVGQILKSLKENDITVKYIANTHGHIDHTDGNKEVAQVTGAPILCHELDAPSVHPDITLKDGDIYKLGELSVKIIYTPGHTRGSICVLANDTLLTGDTLFVGYCGRTDGPGGSSQALYDSLFHKIAQLPNETRLYPGHDYGVKPVSTIGYEKSNNPYYQCRTIEEFMKLRAQGV